MDKEEILNQFEKLREEYNADSACQLNRTAFKKALEAKRFAKLHRLLLPYIDACFAITNFAQNIFEPEIGADNALEIIALVESEAKARRFQEDYDRDEYQYTVHWVSACAYDNLAKHTAMRYGYNSPVVHGAVDDGIHVCRRTGKLECVECFREYAVEICFASGDYAMGEHHALTCATSTARQHVDDRRYIGFKDLFDLYLRQGKFNAAWEALRSATRMIETYHDLKQAQIEIANRAELICLITNQEPEFVSLLQEMKFANSMPEIPSRDENATHSLDRLYTNSVKLIMQSKFSEAETILADGERFLLSHENLKDWFDVRVRRIAARLMSGEPKDDFDMLTQELRQRASKACQWSAIQSLDAMLSQRVKLNPLGIPFPIDIGVYATPGTPLSTAQLKLTLPVVEKPQDQKLSETETQKEKDESPIDKPPKTPLELEMETWLDGLEPLWRELAKHKEQQDEQELTKPFPKTEELVAAEQKILEKILKFTPETSTGSNGELISETEFIALLKTIARMRMFYYSEMAKPELVKITWKWLNNILQKFSECGKLIGACTYRAFYFRELVNEIDDKIAEEIGLPDGKFLEDCAVKAFELEPNHAGIAVMAGQIFKKHGNNREAQRYFARACQLDRLSEVATINLSELYEEAERPKDALAAIDLYVQAGGRDEALLWQGTQIAFRNDLPQEFLFYYKLFTEKSSSQLLLTLESQLIWAFAKLEQFNNVLETLNKIEEQLNVTGLDRMFLRTLCQAELGDDSWTKTFDEALKWNTANNNINTDTNTEQNELQGFFGQYYDPCERLWDHVCKLPKSDNNRLIFEQFLFERGLVPSAQLDVEDSENAEAEPILLGYYRCILRQPLDSKHTAFAGWVQIPKEDKEYFTGWLVLAVNEEEALALSLAVQKRCYPLPAEPIECKQLDSYYAPKSKVVFQIKRFPKYQLGIFNNPEFTES